MAGVVRGASAAGPALPHRRGLHDADREGMASLRSPLHPPQQPDAGKLRQRLRTRLPAVP